MAPPFKVAWECTECISICQTIFLLAELHAELFSRHASPLEVYVFVVADERVEDAIMSDEIWRWNGKQERRRRGGRSVQLPDCFFILHPSSRLYTRIRTYYTHDQIFSTNKKTPSEVRSRDEHIELVCKISGCIS